LIMVVNLNWFLLTVNRGSLDELSLLSMFFLW
jgi:hypothetical protein